MKEDEKEVKGKICLRCRTIVKETNYNGICAKCEIDFYAGNRQLKKFGDIK